MRVAAAAAAAAFGCTVVPGKTEKEVQTGRVAARQDLTPT